MLEDNKVLAARIITASLFIALLIVLVMFVVKPGIIGYGTYQELKKLNYSVEDYGKDVKELEGRLLVAETNLSACREFSDKTGRELSSCSDKNLKCENKLGKIEANFSNYIAVCDEDKSELMSEINESENEINELESRYDGLARNAANNICCKMKVDNPRIAFYEVEGNKIICKEEGNLSISCFGG